VCGGAPADATNDPAGSIKENGFYVFMTPSGNIHCNWLGYDEGLDGGFSGGIACDISQAGFTPPGPDNCDAGSWNGHRVWVMDESGSGACTNGALWGPEEGVTTPVLEYGKSISDLPWACRSAQDGLTCWNTDTHHGFKLSRSAQLTW
jgi:hypothetical protein